MTALHPQAALAFLDAMKSTARELGEAVYVVSKTQVPETKLRCRWRPDMSYGRYHEPVAGDEQFQWTWDVWTREDYLNAPAHLRAGARGWRGLSHQGYALRLLEGEPWGDVKASLEAQGRELASRFSR